jgi:hypothetical protein
MLTTGTELLKIALFAGLIGLAAFCLSYAVLVWTRRNNFSWLSPAGRFALALFLIGSLGAVSIVALSSLDAREGLVDGSNLFVVHARRDSLPSLTDADQVANGKVIAEFVPASGQGKREMLNLQKEKAQAESDRTKFKALDLDQALLQEQVQLRSMLAEHERNRFDLQRSARDLQKDRSSLIINWTRESNELEAAIAAAEISFSAAQEITKMAKGSVARVNESRQRELVVIPELEKRRVSVVEANANEQKEARSLELLQEKRKLVEERYRNSDGQIAHQLADVESQIEKASETIAKNRTRLDEVAQGLAEDRERAERAQTAEIQTAEIQAALASAEAHHSVELDRVQAPFDGRVVYRHPAPGLARDGTPVLALAMGSGFVARVPLSVGDAKQLGMLNKDVSMLLENPLLHRVFRARLKSVEPMPAESDRVLAIFDAKLPEEIVTSLERPERPVRVKLLWQPNVLADPGMGLSLAAAFIGLVGIFASRTANRSQPAGLLSSHPSARPPEDVEPPSGSAAEQERT